MPVKFIDKLKEMSLTKFSWTSFEKQVSSAKEGETDRNVYLIFTLDEPLLKVTGSMSEYDPIENKRVHRMVGDITEIKCNLSVIEHYEKEFTFVMDENEEFTGVGSYAGDLFFDISKQGDVWLTDIKFSKMSSDMKNKNRSERIRDMVDKFSK